MLDVESDEIGIVVLGIPKNFKKKRFRVYINDVYSIFLYTSNGDRCIQLDSPDKCKVMRGVPSSFKDHPVNLRLSKDITIRFCAKKNAYPKLLVFAPKKFRIRRAEGECLLPEIEDPSKVTQSKINT